MAVLKYRDPTSGNWVGLLVDGPAGPTGPAGPAGPTVVSSDAGNSAELGSDGGIFVSGGQNPLTQEEGDLRYVGLSDPDVTITGTLTVKPPTAADHVAQKTNVDTPVNAGPTCFKGTKPTSGMVTGDFFIA